MGEYRPICLVGCLYKITSKILDLRINIVLGNIMLKCKTIFVPGRQIIEGVW